MRFLAIAIAILCAATVAQEPKKFLPALDGGVIQRAINDAVPGQTVTIQRGRYTLTRPLLFRTAVKLKKVDGQWVIDEVRLGDRRWEKAERILAALNLQRRQGTQAQLGEIRQGIQRYRLENAQVPQAEGFTALIDSLSPRYLGRVIRFDSWSNPFRYKALGPENFDLRSAGPDGEFQTGDDILSENE